MPALLGGVECLIWSEIPQRGRLAGDVGLCLSQEGAVGNGACLVSWGEGSVPAGTLPPSFFLPGNSIPGYLLNVILFVLAGPEQPCCSKSCCSAANSEIEFVQPVQECSSLGWAGVGYPAHDPSTSQNLPGWGTHHALQAGHGLYLGSGLYLVHGSETSDSQKGWAVGALLFEYQQWAGTFSCAISAWATHPAKDCFCLNLCHHSDADFQPLCDNRNSEREGVKSLSFAKCRSNDVQEISGQSEPWRVFWAGFLSQGIWVWVHLWLSGNL